ncbi:NAD(P)H-binding protein [Rothia sp. LK2588]|uniref:NAD(P)-dependent oxidoreductase n=1 Tax=Rothia sp. LK2588 TaxID=3114369 RepID=UPI0034CEB7EA
MKIAIIGANGMVGSRVVGEAASRQHTIDGYSRSGATTDPATGNKLDFTNTQAVAEVINSHDYTVIATANRDDYDATVQAHQNLIMAAPEGRFLIVGGAGALELDGKRLYETEHVPDMYRTEAIKMGEVYDAYMTLGGDVQWSMIAPAPVIAPGARTGEYASDLDAPAGEFVSAEDFAIAIVDELENPQHLGRRFTVASKDAETARGTN